MMVLTSQNPLAKMTQKVSSGFSKQALSAVALSAILMNSFVSNAQAEFVDSHLPDLTSYTKRSAASAAKDYAKSAPLVAFSATKSIASAVWGTAWGLASGELGPLYYVHRGIEKLEKIQDKNSAHKEIRSSAINNFIKSAEKGDLDALSALKEATYSHHQDVREKAIGGLITLTEKEDPDEVLRALTYSTRSRYQDVREKAIDTLIKFAEKENSYALTILNDATYSQYKDVREKAADTFIKFAEEVNSDALSALKEEASSKHQDVGEKAADTLIKPFAEKKKAKVAISR